MGIYLDEPITSKKLNQGSLGPMSFSSGEMQGWRKNMQDAAIHELNIGDGNSLFAVFDGHGGPEVSAYVAQIFLEVLKEMPEYKKKDYQKALDLTFKKIDQIINSEKGKKDLVEVRKKLTGTKEGNNANSIGNGTGCTANVILITQDKYVIANIGDSRSALCKEGKAVQFSQDHKPQLASEQKRIIKAGGQIRMGRVNGGLNLTRAFGDFDYKTNKGLKYDEQLIICKPEIKEFIRTKSDDFIIMGCDGIWQRHVENTQGMVDIVKSQFKIKKPLNKIVEDLLNMFLAKDTSDGTGCDNMTAIVISLKPYP